VCECSVVVQENMECLDEKLVVDGGFCCFTMNWTCFALNDAANHFPFFSFSRENRSQHLEIDSDDSDDDDGGRSIQQMSPSSDHSAHSL
jgi:hypothetical protein